MKLLLQFYNRHSYWNILVMVFDLFFFGMVIYLLINDILLIFSYILDSFKNIFNIENILCNMSSIQDGKSSSASATTATTTTTTIIHTNDGWAQGIKNIFIYGTGAIRLQLLRGGGTPLQRGFVVASTIAADAASTALKNSMNDPEYVEKHINSWVRILKGNNNSTVELDVNKDSETLSKLKEIKNKLLPDNINMEDFSQNIINSILKTLKPILEPVSVDYSQEILANQIYGISIILFILSLLILILLLAFMINIIILVYSDKLMDLFTNKYIRWYIGFNKKIIGIEICFLGGSLLYFMYTLSYGIHFIATHPITFIST